MNTFALALASIALVLVNMGIGWMLAKYHSRFRPETFEPLSPDRPAISDIAAPVLTPGATIEETASSNDPEPDVSEFSMSDSDVPEALATGAPLEYYS